MSQPLQPDSNPEQSGSSKPKTKPLSHNAKDAEQAELPKRNAEGAKPLADFSSASGDLRADFDAFIARLGLLPGNLERLRACESSLDHLSGLMRTGISAALRAGIVLALNEREGYYLAELGPDGTPLYKDLAKYEELILERYQTGKSAGQISRNKRAGKAWLKLRERSLPTAACAEPLVAMLPIYDNEEKIANAIAELTQNGTLPFPPTAVIKAHVKAVRPPKAVVETVTFERTVLQETINTALAALTGESEAIVAARSALQGLLQKCEPQEATAKATPPADVEEQPQDDLNDLEEKVHSASVGLVLVERRGCELRTTLTGRNSELFAGIKAYLAKRDIAWSFAHGVLCSGQSKDKGVDRGFAETEAAAEAEMQALLDWAKTAQGL